MLTDKIAETKQKTEEHPSHLATMEATYTEWGEKPDMVPNGKALCCLIEDWSEKHHQELPEEN
ncbi:hypothetical protein [Vibrio sp. 10N.286.49.B3]|uniref:hypothetical protein n=1 Tax=Vibrio sp. 10N.286.49.B3 TaxID=1880855 RepID=UPI0018E48CBC|nr:hypothetical protein [Vibrio sp. 10N.286.49.B3]